MSTVQPSLTKWLQTLRTLALTFAIFIGGQVAGAAAVTFICFLLGMSQDTIAWAFESHAVVRFLHILSIESFTVYFIYLLLKRAKQTFGAIGLKGRPTKAIGIWVVKGYVAYFAIFITAFSVISLTGLIDTNQAQQLGYSNPVGFDMVWAFLALVILPPIAEEIVFRGYLFTRLKKYVNVYIAGILVSLLFAIAHLEIGTGVPLNFAAAFDTLILSIVLVYVTQKSGSLYPAIGIHAVKNMVAFVTLFLLNNTVTWSDIFYFVLVMVLGSLIVLFMWLKRLSENNNSVN